MYVAVAPAVLVGASGDPLQKYTLLVMTQKIQKLNLSSCHHFFVAFYQPVCLAMVSGNPDGVSGGPWCIGFPCGCNYTAPIFYKLLPCIFYM